MAQPIPFNRFGIYGLETIDAVVTNNTLTFVFTNHPYLNVPYNDLILIHFTKPAPATATGEMPVYFETQGVPSSRKAVMNDGEVPLLAKDITVPCLKQFYYNFRTGVVQIVN